MSNAQPRLTLTSILSLSAVSGVSTLITGITPQLQHSFPTIPTTLIEWSVTLANLSALITLMINPMLTQKFGVRRVVVSGLLISGIFGTLPIINLNFIWLMSCRGLLGLGIGLFSPHAISLIAHVYHGDFKTRLMGYQTGISALGNAVLMAIAGILIALSWQAVFGLYLLLLPLAVLAYRVIPSTTTTSSVPHLKATKLPYLQITLCVLAFVTYLIIWGVQLKLPVLFAQHRIGNSQLTNWTLSAMNLGRLLAGLTFGRVHRKLSSNTLTLGYLGAALSVLVMLFSQQPAVAIGAAIFFNYIYSYTGPYLVWRSSLNLSDHLIDFVSSTLTIATIISAFFAPVVWNWLGKFGAGTLVENVLLWIALSLTVIGVGTLILTKRNARG
ncbi:MFS transporter [Lacticaseibacillus porcinae]|uniref:MFS transporter n=1 Tax=Lacticaseibacillus porcinae TaxID=1123687 RepID=UPI000F7794F9|nr:MFS transporter [Lacticaseibacillus porcinae]